MQKNSGTALKSDFYKIRGFQVASTTFRAESEPLRKPNIFADGCKNNQLIQSIRCLDSMVTGWYSLNACQSISLLADEQHPGHHSMKGCQPHRVRH